MFLVAGLWFAGCGAQTKRPGGTGPGPTGQGCPSNCISCNSGTCVDCSPTSNAPVCQDSATVVQCNADGTFGDVLKTCDVQSGELCTAGGCLSQCEVAAATNSYIACDYWPVTLLNSELNPYFDFGVAVSNPPNALDGTAGAPAKVTITRGGAQVVVKTIQPGAVEAIILPWVPAVAQNPKCDAVSGCGRVTEVSVNEPSGAYHLVSSIPVTVYQFNPLQFEKKATATCADDPFAPTANCHSYTNDASLLLPTSVLRTEYVVVSRSTFSVDSGGGASAIPGYFAVVGTVDNTVVTVVSSAYTEPVKGSPAQTPGSTQTYTVNAGQVLQIISKRIGNCAATSRDSNASYCDFGAKYDLTGTHVTATNPIAVFGGHACAFVPYNKFACDHLETQIFPLETWGQKIIVAQTEPQIKGEPNVWRVVSGSANNVITFDPPSVHASITLGANQFTEFTAQGGFQASATGRIAIGQFMVGQYYNDPGAVPMVGDPAMGLGIPVEQYRNSYDFLAPSTYTKSYVNIVAPMSAADLMLDNANVPGSLTAIGGTGFGYVRVPINGGAHHVTATDPFSITVSGIASFTSYLYAGGLNLNKVMIVQ